MVIHTAVWFSIEAVHDVRPVRGVRQAVGSARRHRRGSGCGGKPDLRRERLPLTSVAERLGIERGSVTDLYLPWWFARNLPAIHVPLICLAGFFHARNLRTQRRTGSS